MVRKQLTIKGMINKERKEMLKNIESFAIRSEGITSNKLIDCIKLNVNILYDSYLKINKR